MSGSIRLAAAPVTDLALARRLEGAEGSASRAFVEGRRTLAPASGAEARAIRGTQVMFDGVGSPLTQTFGFGTVGEASAEALEEIEAFFAERGSEVFHEISPLADPAHLPLLALRGYHPVELTTVLWQEVGGGGPITNDALTVRRVGPGEESGWAAVAAQGWGETPELAAFMREFGEVTARAPGTECFLAEWNGTPIAAAALALHGGTALLAGASTIPAYRGRGAQGALLQARLARAAEAGCDVAMMGAAPGSPSQRNAERQGFRIAYTRIKWRLGAPGGRR